LHDTNVVTIIKLEHHLKSLPSPFRHRYLSVTDIPRERFSERFRMLVWPGSSLMFMCYSLCPSCRPRFSYSQ
jgi:hypothetical protein